MSDEKPNKEEAKPKIVVDEDWKAEAEAEKERLSKQDASGPAAAAAGGKAAGADEAARELPPANFATLVSSTVTQILFALGAVEDPQTRRRYRDLPLAKHHIDMLAVLEEKTKGNLTQEEKQLLDRALYEVRMHYVRVAQSG